MSQKISSKGNLVGSTFEAKSEAIVELAECIKELCRIISSSTKYLPYISRLDDVYKKASRAKDRMDT